MDDRNGSILGPWCVTPEARERARLPSRLEEPLDELRARTADGDGLVVASASEVIAERGRLLPDWVGPETFYLVFMDVALPAVMRLPTILGLHKPDRRLHVTRDSSALRRLLIASRRAVPMEGIVDAYGVGDELVLVLGDLTIRSFPRSELHGVGDLSEACFPDFEIDADGTYLRWPAEDVDLSVSAILQAVNPMSLADAEIDRLSREDAGRALRRMRKERELRQRDIDGLSERQVRRLEKGTSRLTAEAAKAFARAFDLSLDRFLEVLGATMRKWSDEVDHGMMAGRRNS